MDTPYIRTRKLSNKTFLGIAMDVAASEFWKADINKYDLG